ncbi:hypothetical protein [Candidatus Laterigemmans baculatus]|uniref:hypothetical protein n=1 Tax=Candidatus Laterigemmans baculatus TaxID=2770505 RepID=UPI0013D90BF5|nr:hypothetical protein [Candidatus Laterigemmans baculatus]
MACGLNPHMSCTHVDGSLIHVTHRLSDQEYLGCDEDGDWRVVLRDDLQAFAAVDPDPEV